MAGHTMDLGSPEREPSSGRKKERVKTMEAELVERRRRIIAKLSPEDQEELAHVDSEWNDLKELKKEVN